MNIKQFNKLVKEREREREIDIDRDRQRERESEREREKGLMFRYYSFATLPPTRRDPVG